MSSLDVTSNILTDNELQPWWEVARSYSLAVMLAASMFLSYNFETIGAVSCRPFNTTSDDMEGADTDFVNAVCVTDYNSVLYAGVINVVGACLLVVISNWWLSNRRVRRAVYSVRKADTLLSQTKYLPSVIEEIVTTPWNPLNLQDTSKAADGQKSSFYFRNQTSEIRNVLSVRDAARKLWLRDTGYFYSAGSSMNSLYLASNLFSLICVCALTAATYIFGLRIYDLIFTCTDPESFSGLYYDTYTCVQVVGSSLTSFIVLYYLVGLSQAVIALALLLSGISNIQHKPYATVIERTMRDNLFILELSKNSTDLSEAAQLLIAIGYADLREKVIQAYESSEEMDDAYFEELMDALSLGRFRS